MAEFGVATEDVVRLDAENATIQVLDDAFLSLELFATKKVVVIPDVGELPKPVANRLVALLPNVGEDTLIILEADKLDQRTELAKAVKKLPTETFEPLQGAALERWIGEQARELGITIEPAARTALVTAVGADSWRLHTELEKLATAAVNESPPRITPTMVKELTVATTSPSLFALTDALATQNDRSAQLALRKLITAGEAPLAIMGLLAYHLRTLVLVKDAAETGATPKLHPFVVRKLQGASRAVSWATLSHWYERLAEYDWEVKTGTIEVDVALELMVHELATPANPK